MIVRAARYAGPSATARTLLGDLLRQSDYDMLLNAADIPELLAALRTTDYRNVLPTQGKSFAFILQHRWIARAEKLTGLMPFAARELCRAYLAKVELEAVKTLLRGIVQGVDRRRIVSMLPPLPAGSVVQVKELLEAKTLEQAAHVLKENAYAIDEVINPRKASRIPTSVAGSLLALEATLDHRFFERLIAAVRSFSGTERAIVERLIGTLADVTNILAAARLRKTFQLTADAALTHLVAFGWHLGAVERRALSNWAGDDGSLPVRLRVHVSGSGLRVALMRMLCGEAMKPVFAAPFQAGLAIAYLLVTELEAADLVTIYEGKRWAFDRTAIADRLIRYYGSALMVTSGV